MLAALILLGQNNAAPPEAPAWLSFLPLIAIFVLFYVFMILPAQRRERKHRDTVLNALKKGDKVLTSSGIIAVVANIKDEEVTLKLEEGKLRVLKSTISKILGPEDPVKDQKQEAGKNA